MRRPDFNRSCCFFLLYNVYLAAFITLEEKTVYGLLTKNCSTGRERRGTKPSHYCTSSGSVARKALQTLETLKLVEKTANGGRILTSQGQRDLDRIAAQVRTALV